MANRLTVIGGISVTLAGLVGLALFGGFDIVLDRSQGAVRACEQKIANDLASPTSFKSVWSDFTPRGPLTWEESLPPKKDFCNAPRDPNTSGLNAYSCYMERLEPKVREKLRKGQPLRGRDENFIAETLRAVEKNKRDTEDRLAKNLPRDQTAFVTIEFDSANQFGTTVRAFAMCRFGAVGDDGRFQESEIIQSGPVEAEAGRQAKELANRISSQ